MVGQIEQPEHITTQWFKDDGDLIVLLGDILDAHDPLLGLGGSAYLQHVHHRKTGTPPRCDLAREKITQDTLLELIRAGLVKSAHDCSEGGLAVALAESCISQPIARNTPRLIGAHVELPLSPATRRDALLFGETQGRIVLTVTPTNATKVLDLAQAAGVSATHLGAVGGEDLEIRLGEGKLTWGLAELHEAWWNSIVRKMR
jgi:phosphoribosylformylglycinamidine synthase